MSMKPNPEIITWAIERSGESIDELEQKQDFKKIRQWIDGSHTPTVRQLQEFAKKTHILFYMLFDQEIPDLDLPIPDFRSANFQGQKPSPELYDTILEMQYRQDWMNEYFQQEGYDPIEFIGSISKDDGMQSAVEKIRDYLKLDENWAEQFPDTSSAFKFLKTTIENGGISVAVNSVVKDSNSRPLNPEEFRGFALSDKYAPLIFINGKDTKSAQMFTLIHELVHLGMARTGVSDLPNFESIPSDERFCNQVAAEILVPKENLKLNWDYNSNQYDLIFKLRKKYKVSFAVVAISAFDANLINQNMLNSFLQEHSNRMQSRDIKKSKSKGGPNYFVTKAYKVGDVLTDAVFVALKSNAITYSEASRLTAIKGKSLNKYFDFVGEY